jgi:Carboxypeptidase regulatory-like domain
MKPLVEIFRTVPVAIILAWVLAFAGSVIAQTVRPGTLRGEVTDPSGAAIPGASVVLSAPDGGVVAKTTDGSGTFEMTNLKPGNYRMAVSTGGFRPSEQDVQITTGQIHQVTVPLQVAVQQQEITVSEVAPTVDASPASNAGAVVMTGTDLDALSDDPDQLQADLEALAGPAAGTGGGQIFIDGFTGGTLPPKSSIREIRINSNPFSAEYDRMGFGRIEILTRAGTNTLHGRFRVQGNTSGFNTQNPFVVASNQAPYHSLNYDGNIGGSVWGKASYTFYAFHRNIDNSAVVNAIVLDPNLNPVSYSAGIANPRTRTNLGPRVDWQITQNNTLTARYQYSRDIRSSQGIGGFTLPSQAYNTLRTEHSLQLSDTQILGESAVNETRFRYEVEQNNQTSEMVAPSLEVTGAFKGGGANRDSALNSKGYELQNYTSLIAGPHTVKFGVRIRATHNVDFSSDGFQGAFTFPSIAAYQITQQGLAAGLSMAQIRVNGGGANQFTISTGTPRTVVDVLDAGLYIQDDWRARPNLTLSGGLRFETQTRVPDHMDFAPRLGVSWAVGNQNRPTVIRAGFGIFYDRFDEDNILDLVQLNGVAQQEYIVSDPDFYPHVPAAGSLTGTQTSSTVYSIAPNYRSPYVMQGAASVERQLTRVMNVSVSYVASRGVHQLVTNNINAPLPGSITAANPLGTRPFGNSVNMFQFTSAGSFHQNQLIDSINIRAGSRLSLFGTYVLNYAHNDTATEGFPSNPYNLRADAGRASNDIRHRVNIGGTMSLPLGLRLSPLITLQSGSPYNFTLGQDLNGDSRFNDRPAFADGTTLPENLVVTPFGSFDKAPHAGQALVPVNYGQGTSRAIVNLRLAKTFTFGPAPAGKRRGGGGGGGGGAASGTFPGLREAIGGRGGGDGFGGGGGGGNGAGRYSLTFNVDARNVFNKVNLGDPVGNITSPLFGVANSLASAPFSTGAAVRRIDLSLAFAF